MCNWLANNTDDICGSRVLELGSGTGACGLYAAGLGASRVLLTDGGSDALRELCKANAASNQHLFASGALMQVVPLRWGRNADATEYRKTLLTSDSTGKGASDSTAAFDVIIASDCTYGHEEFGAESSVIGCLFQTISALLRSGGRCCGAAGEGGEGGVEVSGGSGRIGMPRVILAHEHRSRDRGLPWYDAWQIRSTYCCCCCCCCCCCDVSPRSSPLSAHGSGLLPPAHTGFETRSRAGMRVTSTSRAHGLPRLRRGSRSRICGRRGRVARSLGSSARGLRTCPSSKSRSPSGDHLIGFSARSDHAACRSEVPSSRVNPPLVSVTSGSASSCKRASGSGHAATRM